jgi:broad specificity phosphatase PhoE
MEIILIRHGESLANIGQSDLRDSSLSPLGEKQVKLTAEALRDMGVNRLYCSLMHRAMQTAHPIVGAAGLECEVWPEITEYGFCFQENGLPRSMLESSFPGIPLPDCADEEGWARHWSGEMNEEMYERMGIVHKQLIELKKSGAYEKIAIIIHGRSGNDLLKHLFGIPEHSKVYFHHGNCGITRLLMDAEGMVHVFEINNLRHLAPLNGPAAEVKEYH